MGKVFSRATSRNHQVVPHGSCLLSPSGIASRYPFGVVRDASRPREWWNLNLWFIRISLLLRSWFRLTSQTPNRMIPPPSSAAQVTGSARMRAATITATGGSRYRKAPSCAGGQGLQGVVPGDVGQAGAEDAQEGHAQPAVEGQLRDFCASLVR